MSKYEVAKPFNTVNRRMTVGAAVEETEVLEPFSVAERYESGYLRMKTDPAVVPAAAPVRPPRVKPDAGDDVK